MMQGAQMPLFLSFFSVWIMLWLWIYENHTCVDKEVNMKVIFAVYLSSRENKAWKNSGLYGIWTHDLCDTAAVLYQLS